MTAGPRLYVARAEDPDVELVRAGKVHMTTVTLPAMGTRSPTTLSLYHERDVTFPLPAHGEDLYSFDDTSIGSAKARRSSLQTRDARRPPRLSDREWYALAASACKELEQRRTGTKASS